MMAAASKGGSVNTVYGVRLILIVEMNRRLGHRIGA
jgi:hypothetical protein